MVGSLIASLKVFIPNNFEATILTNWNQKGFFLRKKASMLKSIKAAPSGALSSE